MADTPSTPVLEGWMTKAGSTSFFAKPRRRYFTLDGVNLNWFDQPPASGGKLIGHADVTGAAVSHLSEASRPSIRVITASAPKAGKGYVLYPEERVGDWLTTLRRTADAAARSKGVSASSGSSASAATGGESAAGGVRSGSPVRSGPRGSTSPTGTVTARCYLTFDTSDHGALHLNWCDADRAKFPGALAVFAAHKPVPAFKMTTHGGRQEIGRGVAAPGSKGLYQAVCSFVKTAKQFDGAVTDLGLGAFIQPLRVFLYRPDNHEVVEVLPNTPVSTVDAGAVAAIPRSAADLDGVKTADVSVFRSAADRASGAHLTLST
eukprot:TRINITY_DN1288_c0_g1_i1.p1 TRINITY_DN1288_c0_g1~~TRINITY_DN1288_c0_g1_i1.p1  ORF type:complete len:341 (+),score=40.15 TRINITY_DN1288_c0_g1_i1:66-1025(+)